MEEVKTISLEEKLKAFLENNFELILTFEKIFGEIVTEGLEQHIEFFTDTLLLCLADDSNFDEMINVLRNIELENNKDLWNLVKTRLNDEQYINSIKSIVQKDIPFIDKVEAILPSQLLEKIDELCENSEEIKRIFIVQFFNQTFGSNILFRLSKEIKYLDIYVNFRNVFEKIKIDDIETYYKIVFREIHEEVKKQLNSGKYNVTNVKSNMESIIRVVCPFLVPKEIKNFISYVIEAKNYEDIVNYLKNNFLNKEQFEKFISYLLDNIKKFDPNFLVLYVFYVVKMLKLLDDLNENPRYYLDKIIEIITKKLKTYRLKLVFIDILVLDKNLISIPFMEILVQILITPWLLELIKYCSEKENKSFENILNEIFEHFEKEFPDYINHKEISYIFNKVLKRLKENGVTIPEKEIKRITLE